MKFIKVLAFPIILSMVTACSEEKTVYKSFDDYPMTDQSLWTDYSEEKTQFKLWSPTADRVILKLYRNGTDGEAFERHELQPADDGVWELTVNRDLQGVYYTFQTVIAGKSLAETPGIYARAVGLNGKRAMVLDMDATNPDGWETDKGPRLEKPNDAILYELHVRDLSSHPNSGIKHKGEYLAFTETGTKGPNGVATGLDHLKEMGITHVHLLPTADFYSVDESGSNEAPFNWGYDPFNYNVPEGSYSTDPKKAEVRIREYKQMVKALHDNSIGVVMDVVYNHTAIYDQSNFNLEAPDYYYRQDEQGNPSDASACGNETASNRAMMRKFMVESVAYWAEEYHIDGFRFDLMAIHDIKTMNLIAERLKEINPNIIIYGEGWTAADSPFPPEKRAYKSLTYEMPLISAFSDDMRDGLKGSVFDHKDTGFASGKLGSEERVKFGIVGSIDHPQLDFDQIEGIDKAWASEPWQSISYVSCHDNHTLFDKLSISRPNASEEELIKMQQLANAVVLTSQGVPFLHAGSELLRSKQGVENSYKSPDSINQLNWQRKSDYSEVVDYYKHLIELRKAHPAFRMGTAEEVRANLKFMSVQDGLISYRIDNNANGDDWKSIYVIYNAKPETVEYILSGSWKLAVTGDDFFSGKSVQDMVSVPAISMLVAYQE